MATFSIENFAIKLDHHRSCFVYENRMNKNQRQLNKSNGINYSSFICIGKKKS